MEEFKNKINTFLISEELKDFKISTRENRLVLKIYDEIGSFSAREIAKKFNFDHAIMYSDHFELLKKF